MTWIQCGSRIRKKIKWILSTGENISAVDNPPPSTDAVYFKPTGVYHKINMPAVYKQYSNQANIEFICNKI